MRPDSIELEEGRLKSVSALEDYTPIHERHRVFPAVFENRHHRRVLDISAGVGLVASRLKELPGLEIVCNEVSPKCLACLKAVGVQTLSFDLDDNSAPYPVETESFDAVISLATIEHLIHTQHFLTEIHRILKPDGRLYLSAPNYAGLTYLLPFLVTGKTFHDPLNDADRYEFFAHVRYFTYRTMVELTNSFGFATEAAYLPLPKESAKYLRLRAKSRWKAMLARAAFRGLYTFGSPRWAAEPIVCFSKDRGQAREPTRKVLL